VDIYTNDFFLESAFWNGLATQAGDVVGLAAVFVALPSLLLLTSGPLRASVIGLLGGGLVYTFVFNYQSATHSYYSLYWVPLAAVGLGVFGQWVVERARERGSALIGGALVVLVVVACILTIPATPESSISDETFPEQAAEIGKAVGDDTVIALALGDSMPLFYFGGFAGARWPSVYEGDDDKVRAFGGPDFERHFREETADADVFVVAWPTGLRRQPQLEERLSELQVRARGDGWTVYELG
jgi:hypothetical protein